MHSRGPMIPAPTLAQRRWASLRVAVALGILALFVTAELLLMRALHVSPSMIVDRLVPLAE